MSIGKYNSKSLSSAGKKLYLEDDTADVHFLFESKNAKPERVPAHKILLTAVSEAFRAMFSGTWKEKNEVPIVDATAAGFKEFLQFFYLDEIRLTAENIGEVINLGKMYLVTECVKVCDLFLQDNLTVENVCMVYGTATLFDIDELKRLCEASISINATAVLKSPGFLKCDQKTIGRILKLDTLSCPEAEVFDASMAWVKAASKKDTLTKEAVQAHLGDSFYDIRFGSMKMEEFAAIFDSYSMTSVFTADEHKDIVQMITTDTHKPKFFNENRRQDAQTQTFECSRETDDVDEEQPYHIKEHEVTTFSTNEHLLLKAIVCTGIQYFRKYKWIEELYEDWKSHLTIMEIREVDGEEVSHILHDDKDFKFKGKGNGRIQLPKPIIIRRGFKYQIIFEQETDCGYPICTSFEYVSDEVNIEPGIVIKFHNDEKEHRYRYAENDRMKGGVIRSLEFSQI
ncbi:uncharacterized protein LOC129568525 [Sitodiplosis mosellana]|uniref:uncharacterized protein LOC129568525 n=1 Tax=Sitodiplosis mosellana TaxID=263140 RepID=UPI0024441DD5|nr:uncharacterized protein LOC129568525 [Sitodiplosis mosellana]XP_055302491.1 uncharacterized protein LOC129568525 [Sitodiplosis mosellana]XP_055302492.1 uncharacterized protein LOC129568525 [Sitodiplosis mosellana]XP_055302493.1 uncharacterized protein LOC129568525 [Sitodiplosis mosellana]